MKKNSLKKTNGTDGTDKAAAPLPANVPREPVPGVRLDGDLTPEPSTDDSTKAEPEPADQPNAAAD